MEFPSEKQSNEFLQITFFKNPSTSLVENTFAEIPFNSLTEEQKQKVLEFETFVKDLINEQV